MAKLDNYMVMDFDTIRPILKYISVYGCYTAGQISENFNVSEYKYKENLLRIFYSLNDTYLKKNKNVKSNIVSLQYDRYDNIANLLIRAFKIKTGIKSSVDVYLMLMQVLSSEYTKSIIDILGDLNNDNDLIRSSNIIQYLDYLQRLGFVDAPIIEEKNVSRKVGERKCKNKNNNLIDGKMREKTKKQEPPRELCYDVGVKCYILKENILQSIYDEDYRLLNELNSLLYAFRHILPMSSLAHMVQDTLRKYVHCELDDELTNKDNFILKDCFYWKMLEDEVLLHILYAKERNRGISFKYIDKFNNEEVVTGLPYKILINDCDNRQYLFIEVESSLRVYRLDMIYKIVIHKENNGKDKSWLNGSSKEYPIELCRTGYLDYSTDTPFKTVEVVVDFYFDELNKFDKNRLIQEKSTGTVECINDNHYVYVVSIVLAQISSLIPWLRSFGYAAVVRKSQEHNLYEKMRSSYEEMMNNYA